MKFWRVETGAMTLTMVALVCAADPGAARLAAAGDDPTFAWAWAAAEVTEVTPGPGVVMLSAGWEG